MKGRARRKSVEVEAAMARYEQSRARTLDGDARAGHAEADLGGDEIHGRCV